MTLIAAGKREEGERVLNYRDLKRLDRSYALAEPDRVIEMRLTGNMEKFFWSFDDKKYSEAQPVPLGPAWKRPLDDLGSGHRPD